MVFLLFAARVVDSDEGRLGPNFCWELSVMILSVGGFEIKTQPSRSLA